MERLKQIGRESNQGFSLITVIIAIAFIGTMAMIILGVSSTNFYMKTTKMKGTSSFYTAEKALDEIKAGLQEDVAIAMSEAYTKVLEQYNTEDVSSTEALDSKRQKQFKQLFVTTLQERLADTMNRSNYDLTILQGYVDLFDELTRESSKEELMISTKENTQPLMNVINGESVTLKNIKVTHIDEQGHASVIETDIKLQAPEMTFPTPTNLPDLMNMSIIAKNGIDFIDGQAGIDPEDAKIQIQGNIYGGTHITVGDYLNVEISNNEYVVSKGKVTIQPHATFLTSSSTSLWAEGMDVLSSTVQLLGKTCFADDLTVQRGIELSSQVTLAGEYYGYGSKEAAQSSEFKIRGVKYNTESEADQSSSISINGKHTTLDLTKLTHMMLAGNSYVNSKIQANGSDHIFVTGESLNVKGTQIAYLVPEICIGKDGVTRNPLTKEEYEQLSHNGKIEIQLDVPIPSWDNKTLRELQVDPDNPYEQVIYPISDSEAYIYLYLNFKTKEDATNFFQWYYNGNEERRKEVQQYLDFYLSEDGIKMKEQDSFLRLVTNGNIIRYSKTANQDEVATSKEHITQSIVEEQVNYYNTWYSLTRKMIPNFDMLSEEEKEADNEVFENLIQEEVLEQMTSNPSHKTEFEEIDEHNQRIKAMVLKQDDTFVIDEDVAKELRLLVCTGDVRIKKNVQFQGIIITKGKLSIERGATLLAKPEEASKLLQAKTGDKTLATVFKNGDQYVVTSGAYGSDGKDNNAIYQIVDCITYENWKKR